MSRRCPRASIDGSALHGDAPRGGCVVVGMGNLILSRRKSRTAVYDGDVVERRGLGGRVGLVLC
jgi:hypothetical protein